MSTRVSQTVNNSDPVTRYTTDNINRFTVGVDSSDGNKYKINRGSGLASISDFEIDANGNIKFAGDIVIGGKFVVEGDYRVDGLTTFVNSEVSTIEDISLQLAMSNTVLITSVNANNPGSGIATVTTEDVHSYENSQYVLIQGVEVSGGALDTNINKVHQISNVTSTTFQISLVNTGSYIADQNSLCSKVDTEPGVNGAGLIIEAHNSGTHAPKSILYSSSLNKWQTNIGIDISETFSIGGVQKVSATELGTVAVNFLNLHSRKVESSTTLDLVTNGNSIINIATNGGTSEKIQLVNTQGTASDAVNIKSLAGGIYLQSVSESLFNGGNYRFHTDNLFVDAGNSNVGIGTTNPDSSYKLDVDGDIKCIDLVNISDERFKDHVADIPVYYDLDEMFGDSGLKGVIYKWKKDNTHNFDTERNNVGVYAQNLEKFAPELVNTNNVGFKTVNYEKLTAILVEKLKQLDKKVKYLYEIV